MSSKTAQVKVAGRFPAEEVVALVEVAGPHVLRAGEGRTVTRKRVDEDGVVVFDGDDVKLGDRYFVVGYDNGRPVEVRASGVTEDQASELKQAPITTEPRKFANGEAIVDVVSNADPDREVGGEEPAKAKPAARKRPSRARSSARKPAARKPAAKK